ncbi:transglutaminase family protein [Breoghania sp. L-A4]|uniref:transglutaminase family protein n=1 Tax=Breoghania sp. L-A4 TaxID=2304600 RepID=UPI000E35A7BD|nr:transglutaminase family protein [Breoghania sp. L-A4]AXS40856.1 transglutaminase family protein [Breoghania sp. L-A4]
MRIAVSHSTHYRYDTSVSQSVQHLRLTPFSYPAQTVLDWHIDAPGIDKALSYEDAFGNKVHLATFDRIQNGLTITAHGTIETQDTHGIVGNLDETMPSRVYLRQTDLTKTNPAIRKLAARAGDGTEIADFHTLMQAVREEVAYKVGITETHMSAAEAITIGEGVCQDHAHIFVSAARHIGVPARYVAGYLLLEEGDDSEAHHAWAEVLIEPLGWVGFDVSNGISPTDHHIRLSVGLDSRSAAPIRGVRWGGSDEALDVEVQVTKAAQQQQQ